MDTENIIAEEVETGGSPASETSVPEAPAKKGFFRACGSWTDIFIIAAMLSVLVILLGEIIASTLNEFVFHINEFAVGLTGDQDIATFLLQYFEFYGIWICFMLVITIFRGNWPMWKAFFYNGHGNNVRSVFIGLFLGFAMNGFCILMSCIMGDIKLSFNSFDPMLFFLFLFCVFVQSGAEEIVDRCYLYQKLRRRYRWPAVAILVNALIFMSLHMFNPGVTFMGLLQVFLIGVLFSLIVYYWDSLWTVMWIHAGWNFTQSIVFGLPNSGIVSKYSVFKLDAASAVDGIFYSTSFGVEGSLGANVLISLMIVGILIYALVTKRGERMDHWQAAEERGPRTNHTWEIAVLVIILTAAIGLLGGFFYYVNTHREEILEQYGDQLGIEEEAFPEEAEEEEPEEEAPEEEEAEAPQAEEAEAEAPETEEAEAEKSEPEADKPKE